jgi:hypothetical protein
VQDRRVALGFRCASEGPGLQSWPDYGEISLIKKYLLVAPAEAVTRHHVRGSLAADRRTASAACHVNSMRRSVLRVSSKTMRVAWLDCRRFGAVSVRHGLLAPRRHPPMGRRRSGGRSGRTTQLARSPDRVQVRIEPVAIRWMSVRGLRFRAEDSLGRATTPDNFEYGSANPEKNYEFVRHTFSVAAMQTRHQSSCLKW